MEGVTVAGIIVLGFVSPMHLSATMHSGRKPPIRRFGSLLLVIVSFSSVGLLWTTYQAALRGRSSKTVDDRFGMQISLLPQPFQELITAIQEATRVAAGGSEPAPLTDEERRRWDIANPCRSRVELKFMYGRRRVATDVNDNARWDMVLQEYSKLHRTCRRRVGNLKEYFVARNSSIAGCKFAIADYSDGGGLGNKIVAITNTVLYSILTQRIVLVPSATLVPALMCEPFPGSSWVLESSADDNFPVPPWVDAHSHRWTVYRDVYQELDIAKTQKAKARASNIYSSAMTYYQYQPESRFFCNAEQASFTGVTWLYFSGCLYTIPRFFAVPSLRPTLEALFPDRVVLTHMVRSIMLPENLVWERIVRADAAHMKRADRRVGVQIRYRRNLEEYRQMNDIINGRLMQCAVENGILPSALDHNKTGLELDSERPSLPVVKIFIASLFTGFSDMLSQKYLSRPTSTGEVVSVVQLTHENQQAFGLEVDRQSLVEIMILSFSDVLFVTPLSTFGGLAQAYGVHVPWILDFRLGNQFGPCERGQTVDLCYQEADFTYSCPHDRDLDGRVISEVVPYIKNCLAVDSQLHIQPGFQLITSSKK